MTNVSQILEYLSGSLQICTDSHRNFFETSIKEACLSYRALFNQLISTSKLYLRLVNFDKSWNICQDLYRSVQIHWECSTRAINSVNLDELIVKTLRLKKNCWFLKKLNPWAILQIMMRSSRCTQVFDLCKSVQICRIFSALFCKDHCTDSWRTLQICRIFTEDFCRNMFFCSF